MGVQNMLYSIFLGEAESIYVTGITGFLGDEVYRSGIKMYSNSKQHEVRKWNQLKLRIRKTQEKYLAQCGVKSKAIGFSYCYVDSHPLYNTHICRWKILW